MTAQVLFFNVFSEKDPHLNAIEYASCLLFLLADEIVYCQLMH